VTYNSGTDYTFRERFIVPAERGYFAIDWCFLKRDGTRGAIELRQEPVVAWACIIWRTAKAISSHASGLHLQWRRRGSPPVVRLTPGSWR